MWVNSKEAAEILGVNLRKLQRVVAKAKKQDQKILTIDTKIFSYRFIDGVGRGGKTLQIWIDGLQKTENGLQNTDGGYAECGYQSAENGLQNIDYAEQNSIDGYTSKSINSKEDELKSNKTTSNGNGSKIENNKTASNNKTNSYEKSGKASPKDGKYSHIKSLNENQKLEIISYAKEFSVKVAAEIFGVSNKSVYRWISEYKNGGKDEIKDKRGKRSVANKELIKASILTIGNAYVSSWWMEYVRRYSLKNRLKFDPFDLKADISKATFYRHARDMAKKDADIRNFLRGGLDTLGDANLSVRRDYLKENEEWQVDATNFDFMCLDENGEPKRYTAIGMIDAKSGKRVYELADSPNSYANVRLLKKALINMGRPGYIKGDNGKDYVGGHFQGVLNRLGIAYIKAPPFKGAAKGVIERSHGVIQNFFEGLPGFIGHNAGQRIKKENEALEKSKRLSGVKTNIANLLTKDEMQGMIDEWCVQKTENGIRNTEVGCEFDLRVLGKAYKRVLSARGFSINGAFYTSLELFRYAKIGDECEVIEDIDDARVMHVYIGGEFVCEIVDESRLNLSAEEVKKAKKEYHKKHIAPVKTYIKSLRDEKDNYYKEVAKEHLAKKQNEKKEVLNKESKNKAVVANGEMSGGIFYLPDIDEVMKKFTG